MLSGLTLDPEPWLGSCQLLSRGCSQTVQPCGPSEHGHPQLCSASASGISGSHRVGGLGLGSPGGCLMPSTRDGRVLLPTGFCPQRGGPALGKGQGGRLRGRCLSPCPAPLSLGSRRRGPEAPARRCPGSAAGMQSVTVVPLITEHRCREGSGTKGPLCPTNGAVHSSAGAV